MVQGGEEELTDKIKGSDDRWPWVRSILAMQGI
jgi:hypothetical protein